MTKNVCFLFRTKHLFWELPSFEPQFLVITFKCEMNNECWTEGEERILQGDVVETSHSLSKCRCLEGSVGQHWACVCVCGQVCASRSGLYSQQEMTPKHAHEDLTPCHVSSSEVHIWKRVIVNLFRFHSKLAAQQQQVCS